LLFSEEVAFYQGNKREEATILSTFKRLVDHLRTFIFFRFSMGFVDNIIAKCKIWDFHQAASPSFFYFRHCNCGWLLCGQPSILEHEQCTDEQHVSECSHEG
jgi:hypothetical protein